MKTKFKLLALLFIFAACGAKKSSDTQSEENSIDPGAIKYETYCNELNDFCIDYPDFLIPQGESDNGDGQMFLTENGRNSMMVFAGYRMDEHGNTLTLKEAYMEDRESVGSLKNELLEDHYILSSEMEGQIRRQLSLYAGEKLITLVLQFDKDEKELLNRVFEHVSASLNISDNSATEGEDEFLVRLSYFLHHCWWNQNLNALMLDENSKLREFIDSDMDVMRMYSPGTIPVLSNRDDGFGFEDYDDLSTLRKTPANVSYIYIVTDTDISICELEDESNIYIEKNTKLPDEVVIIDESFEMVPIVTPYPNSEVRSVILARKNSSPWILYFINVPDWGWHLALVDQTPCNA